MAKTSKWNRRFWIDLGERVSTTFLYGVITIISGSKLHFSREEIISIVMIPVILSLAKGLLKNMTSTSDEPTASLVNVSSYPTD